MLSRLREVDAYTALMDVPVIQLSRKGARTDAHYAAVREVIGQCKGEVYGGSIGESLRKNIHIYIYIYDGPDFYLYIYIHKHLYISSILPGNIKQYI